MKSDQIIEEWTKRAEDDELNARSVLKHRDGTPGQACFLSQQIAEKYLKALLVHRTKDYPKTHDLNELATLLKPYQKSIIEELKEEIDVLSPYYIGPRYPADLPLETFTWPMAKEALDAAMKIKDFTLRSLEK